ncbi:MAG TPA: hypothetical protein VH639_08850 [Bryobacteraceae bacterium]
MTAMHQPRVREIVLHLAGTILCAVVQQFLNALPDFTADQWLMYAWVRGAVPIEVAHVQTLPQDLVNNATMKAVTTKLGPFRIHLLDQRLDRMGADHKALKDVCDDRRSIRIRHDCSFAVGAIRVSIAHRRVARIDSRARFFGHSFNGLFAQVEAVIPRHQNLDAVDELLARFGIGAEDFALLHQVDGEAPVLHIERCVVL